MEGCMDCFFDGFLDLRRLLFLVDISRGTIGMMGITGGRRGRNRVDGRVEGWVEGCMDCCNDGFLDGRVDG